MTERLLIDTDPGIDDAAAIMCALASRRMKLVALTTVAGNLPAADGAANALRILTACGRTDIPVHVGVDRPLLVERVHSRQTALGAWTDVLAPAPLCGVAPGHAVDAIVAAARAAYADGSSLTVCAIGPLTNIALALRLYPDIARCLARIVMMGGAFFVPGMRTPWAEFNVYADPHAAQIVFTSGVPITIFPLDVTTQALADASFVKRLSESAGHAGQVMARLMGAIDRDDPTRFGRPGAPIHDAMPIVFLDRPDIFALRPAGIRAVTEGSTIGHTYADFAEFFGMPPNASVAVRVDGDAYLDLVAERILSFG